MQIKSYVTYYDDQRKERFVPHVIEPSSGADRATLAFLCEAYHVDSVPTAEKKEDAERTYLKFHPRLAPVKAAVFPLVKKDGMPEIAAEIYGELKEAGIDVLLDDRKERAGVKFKDCDLIGYPFRVTVGPKSVEEGTIELRVRKTGETFTETKETYLAKTREILETL